jgi:hypothetical protein
VDAILDRACELKQALIEFILESEGELAQSLESYVAVKSRRVGNRYDVTYEQNLLIDSFVSEGKQEIRLL